MNKEKLTRKYLRIVSTWKQTERKTSKFMGPRNNNWDGSDGTENTWSGWKGKNGEEEYIFSK